MYINIKESLNKFSRALDLYQKQLKQNYKTLSSVQNITKSSSEIDVIEDKYEIFNKSKKNSLNSILPKTVSQSDDNKNVTSFIPILAKQDDIQSNSIIFQGNSNSSNILDLKLSNLYVYTFLYF